MNPQETRFDQILEVLSRGDGRFIVIGGLAAMAHGNARTTYDVDVVYARDRDNIERLAAALAPYQPYLRAAGRPKDLLIIAELQALLEERRKREHP